MPIYKPTISHHFTNRVDWDLKIKVADFGLARALQEEKNYYRMNPKGARIPIRWCALESLVDGLFTIKTDTVSLP